jgi:hypothetical protein
MTVRMYVPKGAGGFIARGTAIYRPDADGLVLVEEADVESAKLYGCVEDKQAAPPSKPKAPPPAKDDD